MKKLKKILVTSLATATLGLISFADTTEAFPFSAQHVSAQEKDAPKNGKVVKENTTSAPNQAEKSKTPAPKPADKPKEEEKPAEVVNPTIEKPVETNTGEKIVGATDKGQVIVANDKGETSVVAPEKVGGQVKSDGSIQVKDKSGKLVKIPTTGVEAAIVSLMLAGGSASTAGISTFLRSKRNK